VHKVTVRPWQHHPKRPFIIGKMETRGSSYQLMLDVEVEAAGVKKMAKALVDTGAQTSLLRRGLLPKSCMRRSNKPLVLKTVSGEQLAGGREEADLVLTFPARTDNDASTTEKWVSHITLHDGDIGADIILGYPWLKMNMLDVQPWRDALQLHEAPRWVIRGADPDEEPNDDEDDDEVRGDGERSPKDAAHGGRSAKGTGG
jgi:hypothetical protein